MIKNTVAYLMLVVLSFSTSLKAETLNPAQEKAFAQATVQLLEGILHVDRTFDSAGIHEVRELMRNALGAFNEVGGLVNNQPSLNRVQFAPFNYDVSAMLNTVRFHLQMVVQTAQLLESFLIALERDREIGPMATGYRDAWREDNDWLDEYHYDHETDAVTLDVYGQPVIDFSPPQNIAGHLAERMRQGLRAVLAAMDPILRGVFETRRGIDVQGIDEEGAYEETLDFDLADLADALFNQVWAVFIPRRQQNENGVNLRTAVNSTLRDLDSWLDLTEQRTNPQQNTNANNEVWTYRFHEGQAEAFAEAMIAFLNWYSRMDASSIVNTQVLLEELRRVRSNFRNVLNAPSQLEQYEFAFGIVDTVLGPEYNGDVEDFNPTFVDTHIERARNRRRLNEGRNRLMDFDYDGIALLDRIDEELGSLEEFLENVLRIIREEPLTNGAIRELLEHYAHDRDTMEFRLDALINEIEPVLRNVFGILPQNEVGTTDDLIRGFEAWLERNEELHPLLGALQVPEATEIQPFTYQGNINPRDLFEGRVQWPVRRQMRVDAEPYHPAGHNLYQDPVAGNNHQQQLPVAQHPYPQQVYTTQHIQLQPGAQPCPQQNQHPHTIVFVEGYYPPQQYVVPCFYPQPQQPNLNLNQGLVMPIPVYPAIGIEYLSNF